MTAAEEAKQLDSVTDMVHEKVAMDESKAKDAMTALSTTSAVGDDGDKKLANIQVSKEDIALIVSELEVSNDVAERALREVVSDGCGVENGGVVAAALRKLIVS